MRQTTRLSEGGEKQFSKYRLMEAGKAFSYTTKYDVFLSHSFDDARIVLLIKEMIEEAGHTVYVDWMEDDHLDRGRVNEATARTLRDRMNQCLSLIYLTSQSAAQSLWMPWELGYMDAKTGRIAVAPILEDNESFEGREYLGLYPYLDLTVGRFFIQRAPREWTSLQQWIAGENPQLHV
ncbi:toll/interleukin-1 receptor domain-containing protein [Peristeroidobacter soli]|uniref:toll/interleukin-1 receptor domain-containing protein n=1 Tax=Peristeroidobacter soli TaxID=2497877 RepID=UPI00101D8C86|nr:toll/interleukin-1 receptor domain-containing protein [Peristeroidobacter soli]